MRANGGGPLDQGGSGGSDEKWWIPNTVTFVNFSGLNALAGWMWDVEQDQSKTRARPEQRDSKYGAAIN